MIKQLINNFKEARELTKKMPKYQIRKATPVEKIYEKISRSDETYEKKRNKFLQQCQKKGLTPTDKELEFAEMLFSI